MKRYIILILLLGYMNLSAAKPIVQIPSLPNEEAFDTPEEMFTIKTLEYLSYAIALQTQILMLGDIPKVKFSLPTYEQLSDQEYSLIRQYYIIAKKLEKQVLTIEENLNIQHIEELRKKLAETNRKYDSLYFKSLENYLSNEKLNYFKEQIDSLITENINLAFNIDSINLEYYYKLKLQRQLLNKINEEYYKYTHPALSVSAMANQFMISNEHLSNKLSVATDVLINLNPLFNFGKYFDIWLKYSHPVFVSSFTPNPNFPEQEIEYLWNTDFYSVGLNANFTLINSDYFLLGFKLGVGQFWGLSRLYNQTSPETKYNGQELKFELNFSKNSVYTPFELFVSFNSYFNNDIPKLRINNNFVSDFGDNNFNSISLGIRFVIIRSNIYD